MPRLIYTAWTGTEHTIEATDEQAKHLLTGGFHRLADAAPPAASPAPERPPFPEPAPPTPEERATES